MSTVFKVHWADVAEDDLKSILLYIAEDSPANARKIFEKIKKKHQAFHSCRKEVESSRNFKIKAYFSIENV